MDVIPTTQAARPSVHAMARGIASTMAKQQTRLSMPPIPERGRIHAMRQMFTPECCERAARMHECSARTLEDLRSSDTKLLFLTEPLTKHDREQELPLRTIRAGVSRRERVRAGSARRGRAAALQC